ncbi:butyrophilin subfamily 1 member A1 isoform X2 [Salmo trutta]|uniref:butyrophilin subfamily 1 member A1 isoform X2 n=1 Tax=Salmo trutta TaxID=8032 RepID=UPI0011303FCF|nr:butyrophilin subfamily 1 member A1-like isoform X2 [Salmo trutta]XP_029610196.1 butyrophilin subfamily 1 member A1-like isoform X2 [Salmo trutta]
MGTFGSKPGKQKQSTGDSTKKGYDSTAEQENTLQTGTNLKLSPKKGEKYCTLIQRMLYKFWVSTNFAPTYPTAPSHATLSQYIFVSYTLTFPVITFVYHTSFWFITAIVDASARSRKKTAKFDINQARSHEVNVNLDVDTAHPKLKIDGKSLQWTNESPQRKIIVENCFDEEPFVLGNMGSPLKSYWEVNVKEKDDWVLGVAKTTANRKGPLAFSPTNGFWVIRLSNGQRLKAMEDKERVLDKGIPDKVGIYLDYQERKVTFFSAEEGSLIYSFTNGPSYQDDVLPLFSPWNNDADPITILPITAT